MHSTPTGLWSRRHLLRVLVAANLKRQNKSSTLGYLWWLLDPLLMMAVYYVLVAVVFKRGAANQPFLLFLLCGLLPWKAFSSSVSQSVSCLRGSSGIIKAVSFPKAVLPLSLVPSNLVYFLFGMIVMIGVALKYAGSHGTWPSAAYSALPVIILGQTLFTAGFGLIISVSGLFFADVGNMMSHVLRMWYFLSPGLYGLSQVPERFQTVFRVNPFAGTMTAYRDVMMHGVFPDLFDIMYPIVLGFILLAAGLGLYSRFEGRFVQHL